MRNTVQKAIALFVGIVLAISVCSPVVLASSADVGIEPAYPQANNERTQSIFIMRLKVGEQGKDGIRLINSGKESHTVEIYPTDSSSSVDGSFSCRQHAEAVKDVGSWVKLEKTTLTLEAGEQTIVNFTVDVPKGTGPGEHDGCIAVQDTANLPAKSGSGVLLGFRSAIRLAVTVPGKIVKQLNIVRVDINHVEHRGISVSPVAKNSGNVSLDVTARAQLVSIFGQETEIKNGAKYPIMQGATTGWAYVFEGPYWGGIYKARTSLSYNADPTSGIGQGESSQRRIRKDSGWFIAFPSPLAAVAELAVLSVALWALTTPLRRRLQRRRATKHWQKYVISDGDTLATIAKKHAIRWRKLARRNHIRAPYLIEPGHTILVPPLKKKKRMPTKDLGWLSNDEPVNQVPVSASPVPATTGGTPEQPLPSARPQTEWQSPQAEVPTYDYVQPHTPHTPVKPVAPNPLFPEPDDTVIPDWREGATEDELRQFGILADSSSVSPLQDSWSIDEDNTKTTQKKPAAKRPSSSSPRKKATNKTAAKRSSGKKR